MDKQSVKAASRLKVLSCIHFKTSPIHLKHHLICRTPLFHHLFIYLFIYLFISGSTGTTTTASSAGSTTTGGGGGQTISNLAKPGTTATYGSSRQPAVPKITFVGSEKVGGRNTGLTKVSELSLPP